MKTQKCTEDVDGATEDEIAARLSGGFRDSRKTEKSDSTGRVQSQQGYVYCESQGSELLL